MGTVHFLRGPVEEAIVHRGQGQEPGLVAIEDVGRVGDIGEGAAALLPGQEQANFRAQIRGNPPETRAA